MARLARIACGVAAALLASAMASSAQSAREFDVTGMVVRVDRTQKVVTVSHQAIAGYMGAMTMPFEVQQVSELEGLQPGTVISFRLKVDRSTAYAHAIRVVHYENIEQDPFNASRMTLLKDLTSPNRPSAQLVTVGSEVPDFRLIDQKRRPVALSQQRGKVVVINFVYTTCALPTFCLRMANHFGVLQKRFARDLGKELVLLTVTFDPVHDTPEVLAKYASQWSANADLWRFLTGPVGDVERACALFGVHAFSNDGLLDHSLHTAIIDRQGRLVANIEGNQFTSAQLGDLTESVLRPTR